MRVIVVGLGCSGSAAAAHLAQRGAEVIGLEQFTIGNERGSSGHQSRAFRLAYAEHPGYVPLLQRARELWMEINEAAPEAVFHASGGLYISRAEGGFVPDSIVAAEQHGIPHEVLDAEAVVARWPVFAIDDDMIGLHEPLAGFIVPERAIAAHAEIARGSSAELREGVRVLGWDEAGDGVNVETDAGTIEADRLVLCSGAWTRVEGIDIRPSRQVLAWFDAPPDAGIDAPHLPVWALELADASVLYGFPRTDGLPGPGGFKAARHWAGPSVDPDDEEAKAPIEGDEADVLPHLARWMPAAVGPVTAVRTCMYANSPDGHFRIGLHPESDRVTVIAGLSGHGFKFQPVLGEIAADLALQGATSHKIAFLA